MEFFKAAARRSKRGYGDKLHWCNDAGEAARVLSRDLNAINDNGAIKGMDAREDGVYITYVPSSGADSVTKKLGSEPQLLGTLTGNGTFDCKKIANYKQLTKDNFFIIPKQSEPDSTHLGNGFQQYGME